MRRIRDRRNPVATISRSLRNHARWVADAIKDRELAAAVAAIETGAGGPEAARAAVKAEIERRYTLPA
jgi:hypothetical protein